MKNGNGIEILTAAGIACAALIIFSVGAQPANNEPTVRPPMTPVLHAPWPLPDAERRLDRLDERTERLECKNGVCRVVPSGSGPTPAAGIVPQPSGGAGGNCAGEAQYERSVIYRRSRDRCGGRQVFDGSGLFNRRGCGG